MDITILPIEIKPSHIHIFYQLVSYSFHFLYCSLYYKNLGICSLRMKKTIYNISKIMLINSSAIFICLDQEVCCIL